MFIMRMPVMSRHFLCVAGRKSIIAGEKSIVAVGLSELAVRKSESVH